MESWIWILNFEFRFRKNKEFKNSFGDRMVNTCSVTYCKTGYKQKGQVAEYHPVFEFPDTKSSLKKSGFIS